MTRASQIAGLVRESRAGAVLPEDLLASCAERAPAYDRDNRFCQEDFDELRAAGYLLGPLPREVGGPGLTLAGVCAEQRRLGYHAALSALTIQSHLTWLGTAADLWRRGDRSLAWIFAAAEAGDVFSAGHAEPGNDVPLCYATATGERVDGGYRFSGRKTVGSLSPVWRYLGIHGMDLADPAAPRIVHAFLSRDAEGYRAEPARGGVPGSGPMGSSDLALEGAFVPDRHVVRNVPAGFQGVDPFVLGIFGWTLLGQANIFHGLGRRVFDDAVSAVRRETSLAITRGSMMHHAGCQDAVARMAIELEGVDPHIDRVAEVWSGGVHDGAGWLPRLFAAHSRAVEATRRIAALAVEVSGLLGIGLVPGLERLMRQADLVGVAPTVGFLTREIVGKTVLGVDLDEQPRWG